MSQNQPEMYMNRTPSLMKRYIKLFKIYCLIIYYILFYQKCFQNLLHENDKDAQVLYHYHYFIISSNVLQADPFQELGASFDLTRENAAPLGPALHASFDLTRRGTNDAGIPVERLCILNNWYNIESSLFLSFLNYSNLLYWNTVGPSMSQNQLITLSSHLLISSLRFWLMASLMASRYLYALPVIIFFLTIDWVHLMFITCFKFSFTLILEGELALHHVGLQCSF